MGCDKISFDATAACAEPRERADRRAGAPSSVRPAGRTGLRGPGLATSSPRGASAGYIGRVRVVRWGWGRMALAVGVDTMVASALLASHQISLRIAQ